MIVVVFVAVLAFQRTAFIHTTSGDFMRLRPTKRLGELIRLKGLSQRRLAEQAHVSQAFISLVVSGQRGVRPVTAWRMAAALGVHTSELFVPASTATELDREFELDDCAEGFGEALEGAAVVILGEDLPVLQVADAAFGGGADGEVGTVAVLLHRGERPVQGLLVRGQQTGALVALVAEAGMSADGGLRPGHCVGVGVVTRAGQGAAHGLELAPEIGDDLDAVPGSAVSCRKRLSSGLPVPARGQEPVDEDRLAAGQPGGPEPQPPEAVAHHRPQHGAVAQDSQLGSAEELAGHLLHRIVPQEKKQQDHRSPQRKHMRPSRCAVPVRRLALDLADQQGQLMRAQSGSAVETHRSSRASVCVVTPRTARRRDRSCTQR